ncbi:MAG: GAF domain-containing sensor histidine kinase [Actinobacteria bacterium]|nr:GAF domain-containing sensor histidine kinase [Actinomycetota bacterium]
MPNAFKRISDADTLQRLIDAILVVGSDLELTQVLKKIVESAMELVSARYGALSVLSKDGTIQQFIPVGLNDDEIRAIGPPPIGRGVLSLLDMDLGPVRVDDVPSHPLSVGYPAMHPTMRSFLGVPISIQGEQFGRLYLTEKIGGGTFTPEDEDIVVALSTAAAAAIDKALLHVRLSDLTLLEERERIARDMHDTVIQRLFGVGLMLNGADRLGMSGEAVGRIEQVVEELDEIIRQVRSTIFHLSHPEHEGETIRSRLIGTIDEFSARAGIEVQYELPDSLDRVEATRAAEHLLFSLREALSNVARHAKATVVQISISCDDELVMRVTDNGVGIAEDAWNHTGMGLRNLRDRARLLGGRCSVEAREEGGTELVWSASAAAAMPQPVQGS